MKINNQKIKEAYLKKCASEKIKPTKLGLAMFKEQAKAIVKVQHKQGLGMKVTLREYLETGLSPAKKMNGKKV